MKITTLEKHTNEAELVGLTLLGKGKNKDYRTYKFNTCSHTAEFKTGEVRRNNFTCKECLTEKLSQEAEQVGLTLLSAGRNADYRTYEFNVCGHTSELQTGHVRVNNFICKECLVEKLSQEAEQVGLTLLGKGKNAHYRTYKFNACGHTAELQTGNVRNNSFTCKECLTEKLSQEAEQVGLTLLSTGKIKNRHYRTYAFKLCGHTSEIQIGAVRDNQFRCNECEETSRTQPSSTYLLKITSGGFTWLKYGYAKSIDNRTKQYGLPTDAVVELLKHDNYATGNEAHTHEASNHTKLGKNKLCSKMMSKYHTKSGQTECYPLTMLEQLRATFNAK